MGSFFFEEGGNKSRVLVPDKNAQNLVLFTDPVLKILSGPCSGGVVDERTENLDTGSEITLSYWKRRVPIPRCRSHIAPGESNRATEDLRLPLSSCQIMALLHLCILYCPVLGAFLVP